MHGEPYVLNLELDNPLKMKKQSSLTAKQTLREHNSLTPGEKMPTYLEII